MIRRHLVVFLRRPEYGRGKRRLAAAVGDLAAVRFERAMLGLLVRRLGRDRRWRLGLAVTPDSACHAGGWPRGARISAQGGGDLGERMRRALAACPRGPAVLVGADVPALAPEHVAAAFRLLGKHDVVLGPATDGGFWLIGVRHRPPEFGAVRWSSSHALDDALGNLPKRLSVGFAATLDDVDDAPSWRRLAPRRGL